MVCMCVFVCVCVSSGAWCWSYVALWYLGDAHSLRCLRSGNSHCAKCTFSAVPHAFDDASLLNAFLQSLRTPKSRFPEGKIYNREEVCENATIEYILPLTVGRS